MLCESSSDPPKMTGDFCITITKMQVLRMSGGPAFSIWGQESWQGLSKTRGSGFSRAACEARRCRRGSTPVTRTVCRKKLIVGKQSTSLALCGSIDI